MDNKAEVRVWVDGCFDMVHFGHANALRQAKQLGDKLIVGVHSDEEITINKGKPLFNLEERYKMLCSIKWVDEVVQNAPYVTEIDFMNKYNCDFCAHGDDITVGADGRDTYYKVKEANKFKEFKRTKGVSTTNIMQRILNLNENEKLNGEVGNAEISDYTTGSSFYPNTLLISYFQNELKEPLPGDTIVYIPGSFDLFHVGHAQFLEECQKLGNYIIIGLYSDKDVNDLKGSNYPLMSFYERLLSVLSCKYVSNVILSPPLEITEKFLEDWKIDVVVHGQVEYDEKIKQYFRIPIIQNKLQIIDSGSKMTFQDLIERVQQNSAEFIERNNKKQIKEVNYIKNQNKCTDINENMSNS